MLCLICPPDAHRSLHNAVFTVLHSVCEKCVRRQIRFFLFVQPGPVARRTILTDGILTNVVFDLSPRCPSLVAQCGFHSFTQCLRKVCATTDTFFCICSHGTRRCRRGGGRNKPDPLMNSWTLRDFLRDLTSSSLTGFPSGFAALPFSSEIRGRSSFTKIPGAFQPFGV